ncbi:uncharacterized protein LOC126832775 [Adelges cooleyi]|uniref:uncharacterized protein LOC126832775 n=1 Tax=Adelges cooleyi TaxID=133065 RepID=UPI00217FC11B|nr:uncharacterized protein LOC126832775 [Adelges cooleyi]XP_050419665.1 uncharacterized protein LOC126832775 [Adelges cooleyi]XP_050419666.1 uncharacterized protein LOC126832775 [Adelges cooleyi]XP_050419667.1 uncharacterized protein LOC126832775 [Adelges cooleyi]XP_050419669.1 uncharacterized protein LOC126832775 [Adelges cooleyi]
MSKMDHLSTSSFQTHIKNFILAAKKYSNCRDDPSSNGLLCALKILGQPSDQFLLNVAGTLEQEFFINLYELMNEINDNSEIIWAAINVLQVIIKQEFTEPSIIHKYNFTLILTKVLKDQLSLDRKIKVLKLLQELTYGQKTQWQESYLPELISLLVKWISNNDKDLVSFSLGVLVNVCCKNKLAMFTLVKCTDSKSFMRLLLKIQSNNIFIRVQVYKLLLVLEQVSGQVPHVDVNHFIDVTFAVLEEGLKLQNVCVLRHVVDFFVDICDHSHWKDSVVTYSNYKSKLTSLLQIMKNAENRDSFQNGNNTTLQCVHLVLQFIHYVIQLKIGIADILYPDIILHISYWAQFDELCTITLPILQSITYDIRNRNSSIELNLLNSVNSKLEQSLNVLFNLFDNNSNLEISCNNKTWEKYTVCFRLLQEMLKLRNLYEKIDDKLNCSSLQLLFHSLMLVDIKIPCNLENIQFVYVEALCLLSDLVNKNPKWMSLYSEVLNQKHVYYILAFVIYNGSKKMKQRVLDLITKFSQQSTLMLSECLEELNQIPQKQINSYSSDIEMKPLCTLAQENQIQTYINQLDNMFTCDNIQNVTTSRVIQLYQSKVNLIQHSESWLKQSLNNASKEITHLNHKIVGLHNESSQLHHILLESHQSIDALTMENNELKYKFNKLTEQLSIANNNLANLTQNYESKRQMIKEQDETIKKIEKQLEELHIESTRMREDLLNQLQNEKMETKKQVSNLEQQLTEKQCFINEKVEEIDSKKSLIKNLENNISDREKDINDLRKQLEEQHRVREMISQMLAATSSKP